MNVPWNNLSNSPVIVNLDGLYVLLEPESKENWKPLRTASVEEKESILSNFTNALLKELEVGTQVKPRARRRRCLTKALVLCRS